MLFLALNNDLHQINVKAQAWTKFPQKDFYHKFYATSGCGSDGRAVAWETGDPWIESSHQQILFTLNCIEKCV